MHGGYRQPISPMVLKGLRQSWREVFCSEFEILLFYVVALTIFFGGPCRLVSWSAILCLTCLVRLFKQGTLSLCLTMLLQLGVPRLQSCRE